MVAGSGFLLLAKSERSELDYAFYFRLLSSAQPTKVKRIL
jgi:hypothetical protein